LSAAEAKRQICSETNDNFINYATVRRLYREFSTGSTKDIPSENFYPADHHYQLPDSIESVQRSPLVSLENSTPKASQPEQQSSSSQDNKIAFLCNLRNNLCNKMKLSPCNKKPPIPKQFSSISLSSSIDQNLERGCSATLNGQIEGTTNDHPLLTESNTVSIIFA
jgi:hypothetical protein